MASAGVLIGFSGSGWMSFWFDADKRLQVAKQFQQQQRIIYLQKAWGKDRDLKN